MNKMCDSSFLVARFDQHKQLFWQKEFYKVSEGGGKEEKQARVNVLQLQILLSNQIKL